MAWLNLPIWQMFVTLAIGFGAVVALLHAVSFSPWLRAHAIGYVGVVPSYFSALAVLLALLTGFVANDTWERQKQATRVIQSEGDNVMAVHDLSIAASPDMSKVRDALKDYVAAVVQDEWPQMAEGRSSSRAAHALEALLQEVAHPQIAAEAGTSAQSALLNSVLRIRSDRGERLALNMHPTDETKWLSLFILGVLTQVSIAIVHLERPRAQLAALLIFTVGLVSTLGLIGMHEWPFDGPAAIKPTALIAALGQLAGP